MIRQIRSDFLDHAHAQAPNECCGVVIQNNDVFTYCPCRNIDSFPTKQFTIHPEDWVAAEDVGKVVAVCHSHINQSPQASDADRVGCEASGLPWLIIALPSEDMVCIEPVGYSAPLVGREFVWGIFDCTTLIADYYRQLGVIVGDYTRTGYDYNFWQRGQSLLPAYQQVGFVEVQDEPRLHDVFLLSIRSDNANHAAVYLGDGVILHHLEQRLSERVIYGGYWQKHTRHQLRHVSLC